MVFDETFAKKPSILRAGQSPKWGGYRVEFKIIEKDKAKAFSDSVEKLRRNATIMGDNQERKFSIDISKHEFCSVKQEYQLDDYTIYTYTLPMMALEKVRALCQQLPGYSLQTTPRPRAQDFYDIHALERFKK
ncbi:MAG TPA: nucleotidyl transferase AbiEii/AbiGii toxin family protein [Verrucomicrobiae bacterium]